MNTTTRGQEAEKRARAYLTKRGIEILTHNYRSPFGEIDIIARDGKHLVFVEVRYRKNNRFGEPFETIDHKKQSKLCKTALHYLQRHANPNLASRFDVIAMTETSTDWIKNAFEAY